MGLQGWSSFKADNPTAWWTIPEPSGVFFTVLMTELQIRSSARARVHAPNALTGAIGNTPGQPALKASCFTYRCSTRVIWRSDSSRRYVRDQFHFREGSAISSGNPGKSARTFPS